MSEISIPLTVWKQIVKYVSDNPTYDDQQISIRKIESSGICYSFEVKIPGQFEKGVTSGVYAVFSDLDKW